MPAGFAHVLSVRVSSELKLSFTNSRNPASASCVFLSPETLNCCKKQRFKSSFTAQKLGHKNRFPDQAYFSGRHQTSGDNGKHWQVKAVFKAWMQDLTSTFPTQVSYGDDKSWPKASLHQITKSKRSGAAEMEIHLSPGILPFSSQAEGSGALTSLCSQAGSPVQRRD